MTPRGAASIINAFKRNRATTREEHEALTMAEYVLCEYERISASVLWSEAGWRTEEQPKIVRCKDCNYWVCIEHEGMQHTACKLSENPRAPEYLYHPSAKDFCSRGTRKDEVEE